MSEVKNFEMNKKTLENAKNNQKKAKLKKAAEAMFGPLGKTDKPTKNLKQRFVDIKHKRKLMKKVL